MRPQPQRGFAFAAFEMLRQAVAGQNAFERRIVPIETRHDADRRRRGHSVHPEALDFVGFGLHRDERGKEHCEGDGDGKHGGACGRHQSSGHVGARVFLRPVGCLDLRPIVTEDRAEASRTENFR